MFLIWLNDGHPPMLLKIVQSHKIDPMRPITRRWAASLIVAFALPQWSVGLERAGTRWDLADDTYFSAARGLQVS